MAIYVEYEGIKGDCTADAYADHFSVQNLQFGIGRGITMEPGNLANREANRPTISEITFTKAADGATTELMKESVSGVAGKTVKIKFVQTGTDKVTEYMDYELTNCIISGFNITADGEGTPQEMMTLSFSKFMANYTGFDATNKNASLKRMGYDLETAKPL